MWQLPCQHLWNVVQNHSHVNLNTNSKFSHLPQQNCRKKTYKLIEEHLCKTWKPWLSRFLDGKTLLQTFPLRIWISWESIQAVHKIGGLLQIHGHSSNRWDLAGFRPKKTFVIEHPQTKLLRFPSDALILFLKCETNRNGMARKGTKKPRPKNLLGSLQGWQEHVQAESHLFVTYDLMVCVN